MDPYLATSSEGLPGARPGYTHEEHEAVTMENCQCHLMTVPPNPYPPTLASEIDFFPTLACYVLRCRF